MTSSRRIKIEVHAIDAALLLMTIIWGSNFTIVKVALRDIPQLPFNALRLVTASAAFLVLMGARRAITPLTAGSRAWGGSLYRRARRTCRPR